MNAFIAKVWPFEVGSNPVLAMGVCLLPKKLLALPPEADHWMRVESFADYTRFFGLHSCTGGKPLRFKLSIDGEVFVDELLDLLVGNAMFCFTHPALVHRFTKIECSFSHPELAELLSPILMWPENGR
jgi:hypothetical protein